MFSTYADTRIMQTYDTTYAHNICTHQIMHMHYMHAHNICTCNRYIQHVQTNELCKHTTYKYNIYITCIYYMCYMCICSVCICCVCVYYCVYVTDMVFADTTCPDT